MYKFILCIFWIQILLYAILFIKNLYNDTQLYKNDTGLTDKD